MPRALWTGSISFGLVNVPVRLYSAISEHKLQFHFVHEKDDSPIGYQKICKTEDKPVPEKEIVKAFEYRKGKYVYMEDEDFEAARVDGYKTIDITDFVPYEQIDPIYFAHTYYVGPQEGSEKVYSLLVKAMEDSELAGIAKFVMRDRQYLGALRVRVGTITLEQLYFADEVRPVEEIKPKRARVEKRELEMAQQLIDSFAGDWKPEQYKDTYRDALCEVIEAKRKGKEVHVSAEAEEEQPTDLISALRASVEASKGGRRRSRRAGGGSNGANASNELEELSKSELEKRAKTAEIEGRSRMSKEELIDALRSAA
jgi:DNA end-binding protein Ku